MIYFIRSADNAGPIKIGTTTRLSVRLKQLEAKERKTLCVLGVTDGSYADEKALHDRFVQDKGEWFYPKDDLLNFIATECRQWDGIDEAPDLSIVKLDRELIRDAKIVALRRGVSLTEYLTEYLESIVQRDVEEVWKRLGEDIANSGFQMERDCPHCEGTGEIVCSRSGSRYTDVAPDDEP